MIKCGIKLWTNNNHLFKEAVSNFKEKAFDFIEIYHNAGEKIDFEKLEFLKGIPIIIHAPSSRDFHEFNFGKKQLAIWETTKKLADYFQSPRIIVHAGRAGNFNNKHNFSDNFKKIDDRRIIIENMAGVGKGGNKTFGSNLDELIEIRKNKEICFDFEKAVKSACHQSIGYKKFISDCLGILQPRYFHISGGDMNSSHDEHLNLWDANYDLKWIKKKLIDISQVKDVDLLFETPKNKNSTNNDLENLSYFKFL